MADTDTVAAKELAEYRRKMVMDALYDAAMSGASDTSLLVLCGELGVTWKELRTYQPQSNPAHNDVRAAVPF